MDELLGSAIYWIETSHRDPAPSLKGGHRFDVAIIGGGYTGLWTAFHLLKAEPTMSVAILEAGHIGFGASGRNGGFAMTLLDMSLARLRSNHGDEAARAAHSAVALSVEEIGETITSEGIDCEWRQGGLMVVATNRSQLVRIEADLEAATELGLDGFSWLDANQAQSVVHSPTYRAALREEHCGVVHPAKLARGLAKVVESMGAAIYEYSAVDRVESCGSGVRVSTRHGSVECDQVILATNAWAAHQAQTAKRVVPLYTYITLTEPLSDSMWDSVGWDNHCGIEDKRNYVHYYRRTLDGRILWGGSDGVVHLNSRIAPRFDQNSAIFKRLRNTFRHTFPQLGDLRFTHHWGGPVGITSNFVPTFATTDGGRVHYGVGYNGHGVAPSHTGGKILRDKVLGRDSDLTRLCFVDSPTALFPPEPFRWAGAEISRRAMLRQDAQMDEGRLVGEMDPLILRVLNRLS